MIGLLGGWALAVVFGSAAFMKVRSFRGFKDYLRLFFGRMAAPAAGTIIAVEVVLAVGLAVAPERASPLILSGSFVIIASIFQSWRVVKTDDPSCSCWGSGAKFTGDFDRPYTVLDVLTGILAPVWIGVRNGLLLLAIWLLLDRVWNGALSLGDWRSAVVSCFPLLTMLVGVATSILKNRSLLRQREHPRKAILAPRLGPLVAVSWYMGTGVSIADPVLLGRDPDRRWLLSRMSIRGARHARTST